MRTKNLLIALVSLLSLSSLSWACTDFRLAAKDGTVMVTRTLEFGTDLASNLRSSNRNRSFQTTAPDGKPGMAWKAKYGYVFLDGMNQDFAIDGMNEQGLSVEALYLPGATKYQTVPAGKEQQALPYLYFGDWLLSNFKNVDEVKQALPNIYVFAFKPAGLTTVFPLHYSIQDASGKGLVVEFVNGMLSLYENSLGVMTNSPTYNWQMTNLNNYLNLSPYNPKPIVEDGMTFAATGQGAGAIGLPGDSSPPSRFVKMTYLTKTALPINDAAGLLNLSQHIINNVDIPLGSVRTKQSNGSDQYETTQWTVFKDLTHKMLYYRTYGDLTLHGISMDSIDFSDNAKRLKMPIASKQYIQDQTEQFKNS